MWRAETAPRRHHNCLSTTKSAATAAGGLSVNELIPGYMKFAAGYYRKNGEQTQEYTQMKYALRPVRQLYGRSKVTEFGPLALKAIRTHMMEVDKLSREVINHRVNRIRRVFRWGVGEELVPPMVYEALRAVSGLRYGRTDAREAEPVKPVPDDWVDAVLPHLSPQVAAMVQLQRLTGMRPAK